MIKKKSFLLLLLSFTLTCGVATFFSGTKDINLRLFSIEAQNACVHNGFHYDGHESTLIKNGNKEFWACCKCHSMYFTNPGGTWTNNAHYSYNLKETEAYLPSIARNIGNLSTSSTVAGQLEDYAFENYYSISGLAQHFLKDNINISRYQTVTFAIKSESLWFIVQDPTWAKSLPYGYWYQIVLEQSATNTWDIYVAKLGEELQIHASSFSGTDLKTIVRLGSDSGNFYITNFMAVYKQTEIMGEKIDECLFTSNGIQTYKTYEGVPSGFEQVRVTPAKTNNGEFYNGVYYSSTDLSSYSKVKFALKTTGYFLCNHSWNEYVNGSFDWLIFELTKTGTYTWDLVISTYNGVTYYTENNLSGDMGVNPAPYSNNSLNAILYGNNKFFASKKDGVDLVVYSTEIRAYTPLTIDNSYHIIYQSDDSNAYKASQDLMDRLGRASSWNLYLPPAAAEFETYSNEAKYISIGNTTYANTAGVSADSEMGLDGYAIVTKGKSIIVIANSSRGIMPAIRNLLKK